MDDNVKNTDNITAADRPKRNNNNRSRNRNRNYYKSNKPESGENSQAKKTYGGSGKQRTSESAENTVNKSNSQNRSRNKNRSRSRNGSNSGVSKTKGYYMTKTSSYEEEFDELFKDVFEKDSVEENSRVNDNFADFEENENSVREERKAQNCRPKKKRKPVEKSEDYFSETSEAEEIADVDFSDSVREERKAQNGRPKKKRKPAEKSEDYFSETSEAEDITNVDFSDSVKEERKAQNDRPKKKKKPAEKSEDYFAETSEAEEIADVDFSDSVREERKVQNVRPKKKRKPVEKSEDYFSETSEAEDITNVDFSDSVKEERKTQNGRPKKKKKPAEKSEDYSAETSEAEEIADVDFSYSVKEERKAQNGRPKKKKKPAEKSEDYFSETSEAEEIADVDFSYSVREERKAQNGRPKKKKKPVEKSEDEQPVKNVKKTKTAKAPQSEDKNKTGKSRKKDAAEIPAAAEKLSVISSSKRSDRVGERKDNAEEDKDFAGNKKKSETRFWVRMFSLAAIVPVYAAIVICMIAIPRSTVSNLEKRNLATFPEFSWSDYWNGTYTANITHYFDDTVPFRDSLKQAGSQIMNLFGIQYNNVQVTGQMQVVNDKSNNSDNSDDSGNSGSDSTSDGKAKASYQSEDNDSEEVTTPKGQEIADGVYTNGTIVVYQDGHYRSMAMYGGGTGDAYVDSVNKFAEDLPGVKVYSMVDPTSSEFYTPLNFSDYNASQSDDIKSINSRLKNVNGINVCPMLAKHVDETIYTRTDHHWMSLGAYYAAQKFAEEAGVSFKDIAQYSKKKTPGYVGTMYSFSGNNANLLNDPEDFIYYVPKTKDYTVEYYDYGYNFIFDGDLMVEVADVSEMYSSYIGGDGFTVKISTGVKNGRKLCMVKDSYGNALPQFLIGSFEEIYVVDMRYFELNLVDFIKKKNITDLLFSCCSYSAVGPNADNLEFLRTMGGSVSVDDDNDNDDKDIDDVSSTEAEDNDIYDDTTNYYSDYGDYGYENDDLFNNIYADDGQLGLIGNINDDTGGDDDIGSYFDDDYGYDEDYY